MKTKILCARTAFTLVEVLVAVAILAVLVSILIPSLSGARKQSKVVACAANLRSIGQLFYAYAAENEDGLPRGPRAPSQATSQMWIGTTFQDNTGYPWPAQYEGLGLLTKLKGAVGNEMLFCPDDGLYGPDNEGKTMGVTGQSTYGSYLYRQLEAVGDFAVSSAKINELGNFDFLDMGSAPAARQRSYKVQALVVDRNYFGPALVATPPRDPAVNHDNDNANVLYMDGSVTTYDNEGQEIPPALWPQAPGGSTPDSRLPWASIPGVALGNGTLMRHHIQRIFIGADFGLFDKPWRAPIPVSPGPAFGAPF